MTDKKNESTGKDSWGSSEEPSLPVSGTGWGSSESEKQTKSSGSGWGSNEPEKESKNTGSGWGSSEQSTSTDGWGSSDTQNEKASEKLEEPKDISSKLEKLAAGDDWGSDQSSEIQV